MKQVRTLGKVLTKLMEIVYWGGACVMLLMLGTALFAWDWLSPILTAGIPELGRTLSSTGFELIAVNSEGVVMQSAIVLFFLCMLLVMPLMAMILRRVFQTLKAIEQHADHADAASPFRQDAVSHTHSIGLGFLAIAAVEFVISLIAMPVVGVEYAWPCIHLECIVMGVIALSLSQVFSYGKQLEAEVDGLL